MSDQSVTVNVNTQGKNIIFAYALWFFLGYFGIHRFYLEKPGTGLAQLLLNVVGFITAFFGVGFFLIAIWFVWWALDAYYVQKYVSENNASKGINNSSITVNKSGDISNELDQLEKLHSLKEKGILSEEEYNSRKEQLLS